MMEYSNLPPVGFLLFAAGFLLSTLQMLPAAALSCDPSTEVFVGGNKTTTRNTGELCRNCWSDIQTLCNSQGRPVSKIECNWYSLSTNTRTTVCVGCCGEPLPPPLPVITERCQAGDADLSFSSPMTNPENCGICQNGCKTKCDARNGTVFRETCKFDSDNRNRYFYGCNCCCRVSPPPPPPPPSPPPPSPPPPSPPPPSPPPPTPPPPSEPICDTGDIYLPFQLPSTSDCDQCTRDCKTKCLERGSTEEYEVCNKTSSTVYCDCCCVTS